MPYPNPEAGMPQPDPRADDQLVEYLEANQLVSDTSRPVPRAQLTARVRTALWTLRIFVVLLTIMVIYTFISQLA